MMQVCYGHNHLPAVQIQWNCVIGNFRPDKVFIVGAPVGHKVRHNPTRLEKFSDLPEGTTLVVMAAKDGQHLKGTQTLKYYEHPEKATYIFGGDGASLTPEDLANRYYQLVYVPTITQSCEMYAHVAAAITLYDRLVKCN